MMSRVGVTLTLSLVTMAAAMMVAVRGDDLLDSLHVRPLRHHRYHFEVTSEAGVGDLKGALGNFTLDYSFKVIGEPRYFFVIQSNDTEALRHLTFPRGSSVTQFPVERMAEYIESIGIDPELWNFTSTLPTNKVLTYTDLTLNLPDNVCWETFRMQFQSYIEDFSESVHIVRPVEHPVLASYPLRTLSFVDADENWKQHALREKVKEFGGDGAVKITVVRIVHV